MGKARTEVVAAPVAADAEAAAVAVAVAGQNDMSQHLLQIIGAVVLIVIGTALFTVLQFFGGSVSNTEELVAPQVREAVHTGNFGEAISGNEAIQNNPSATAEQKAFSTYNALGAEYRLTGDVSARISDIQEMKKIITDTSVSNRTRVNTLNVLVSQYSISGKDPRVFEEIYKGEPFSKYLVPGDPELSARKLAEWSYEMLPTSSAAISIARWYSEQKILNPGLSATIHASYVASAEDYLKKAETAATVEARNVPSFTETTRYLVYRYWHAIVTGRLADQKGEPYRSEYRSVYDKFILFTQSQQNVLAQEYLLYARLFYAQRLSQNNDIVAATKQLDLLAEQLTIVADSESNVFVRFLKIEAAQPNGANWRLVEAMSKLSSNFETAVQAVITSR